MELSVVSVGSHHTLTLYSPVRLTIAPIRWAASAPRLPPLRHRTRSMLFWFWFGTEALRHAAAVLIRESRRGSAGTRFYSARGRWQGSRSGILEATWHERNCSRRRTSDSSTFLSPSCLSCIKKTQRSIHQRHSVHSLLYSNYCNQPLDNNNNNIDFHTAPLSKKTNIRSKVALKVKISKRTNENAYQFKWST